MLDHCLRRMKQLGALDSDPDVNGGYRFPSRLHALHFHTEARTRGGAQPGGVSR